MCDECQEMDILEDLLLYTKKEIRALRDKRKDISLKNLRTCKFDGFLVALKFDLNLIDDIQQRRSLIINDDYTFDVDYIILKRIVDLHSRVIELEPRDQRVLLADQYGIFTTKMFKNLDRLINLNPKVEEIWILASKWCFNLNLFEKAKKYLCRGVIENPTNLVLFKELFNLELAIAVKKHNYSFDNARKVFNCIQTHIPQDENVDYYCSLIDIADDYDKSDQLQNEMILTIKNNCCNSAYFWNFLAQRELMGKHSGNNENEIDDNTAWKHAWEVFKLAIEKLPTIEMWRYYLKTALITSEATQSEKYLIFKSAYEYMLSSGTKVLQENDLVNLARLESEKDAKGAILKLGSEEHPDSVLVWSEYTQFIMQQKDIEKFESVFQRGVRNLEKKSLPLWQLKLEFVSSQGWKDIDTFFADVRSIYLEGISTQPLEVSETLIMDYLDWSVTQVGMSLTRKAYYSVSNFIPTTKPHKKMLDLELIRPIPVDDIVSIVLNLAINKFGKKDAKAWLLKIEYLKTIYPTQISEIQEVYKMAMQSLSPSAAKQFDIQFQLFNLQEHID